MSLGILPQIRIEVDVLEQHGGTECQDLLQGHVATVPEHSYFPLTHGLDIRGVEQAHPTKGAQLCQPFGDLHHTSVGVEQNGHRPGGSPGCPLWAGGEGTSRS